MKHKNVKKSTLGQTAVEYALVIGVISMGVIFAGKAVFGGKDSAAGNLMTSTIKSACGTLENSDDCAP